MRPTCVDDDVDEVHALGEGVAQVDVVEGDDGTLALGPLESFATLQRLLASHLVLIELGKVVDDNRNGQSNHQDTTNATDTSYYLSEWGRGVNITVTDGGHCDTGPPESLRDTDKFGARLLFLGEVRQAGEDEHAHREEQHQQAEFLVRVAQSEAETLQTRAVPRQFQYTQDPHDSEDLHDAPHVLELIVRVLIGLD